MAITSSLTLSGTVSGLPEGSNTISITYANSTSPGFKDLLSLTTTPVAVTIPTNTLFILIIPPSTNTTNILVSGATAETVGTKIHPSTPTLLAIPASSPNLFLFAASGTISNVQVYFI